MSGFTRDPKYYGDRLVYEALGSKWDRYHARCGCGRDWVTAHAEPAGFTVVRERRGFIALVGRGLTEGVDESALTTNALWAAVTGTEPAQDWFETVRVIARAAPAEPDPDTDKDRKAPSASAPGAKRPRASTSKAEPITAPQLNYLSSLATKVSRERFDEDFARAREGSAVAARQPEEKTQQVVERCTKDVARKLITALSGRH